MPDDASLRTPLARIPALFQPNELSYIVWTCYANIVYVPIWVDLILEREANVPIDDMYSWKFPN
jgi:hypothetical protein